jgi:hypothetical protein
VNASSVDGDPGSVAVSIEDYRGRLRVCLGVLSGGFKRALACCKVSDEAAFCLIQRPYISKNSAYQAHFAQGITIRNAEAWPFACSARITSIPLMVARKPSSWI